MSKYINLDDVDTFANQKANELVRLLCQPQMSVSLEKVKELDGLQKMLLCTQMITAEADQKGISLIVADHFKRMLQEDDEMLFEDRCDRINTLVTKLLPVLQERFHTTVESIFRAEKTDVVWPNWLEQSLRNNEKINQVLQRKHLLELTGNAYLSGFEAQDDMVMWRFLLKNIKNMQKSIDRVGGRSQQREFRRYLKSLMDTADTLLEKMNTETLFSGLFSEKVENALEAVLKNVSLETLTNQEPSPPKRCRVK